MYICLINLILICLFQSCGESPSRSDKFPTVETSKEQVIRTTFSQKGYQEFKIEFRLKEISGLAVSSINKNSIYLHEDSGNEALIYVVSTQGKKKGKFGLKKGKNKDWEDIAVGPGPKAGKSYLYIADIGDNARERKDISIYRLPEPVLSKDFFDEKTTLEADEIRLKYPQKAADAEAILIEPASRDIYVVTKEKEECSLFKAAYPQSTASVSELEKVGTAPIDRVTSGGISTDGKHLVLKNLSHVFYWRIGEDKSIAAVLSKDPQELPYKKEPQGEAFCFDGLNGYFTTSELHKGKYPELRYYPFIFN